MIEPANENVTPRDSNESQISDDLPQLALDISIASAQINGSESVETNDRNQSNEAVAADEGKCCSSDSHKGNGKSGKELDFVEANYLKVNVDKVVDKVYRYDIDIRTEAPKKLYTKIFFKFCAEVFIKQAKQIAFDDDKMIAVSPCLLDMGRGGIRRKFKFALPHVENDWKQSKKSKNHQLNKTWPCDVTMSQAKKYWIPLKQFLAGEDQQHRYNATHAMNTILNSAYHQEHLSHGIQDGRSLYLMLNDKLPYLKEHYDLRSGLHQRIILDEKDGSMRPLLNIDVTHRAFPRQYTSLIDLLHAIQREQTTPRILIDFKKPLPTDIAEKLAAHLDGLEICYKIDDTNNGIAKFFDIGFRSAFEIFSKKDGNTKMVQEYFTENKLEIKHPFLQCIRLGFEKRHFSVPMECCSIRGDQLVQKKLSQIQSEEIKSHTIMKLHHRKDMIMHHLQAIGHNKCDTIRAFGLSVEENFASVPARQLQTPLMEYRDRKMIQPKNGEWAMSHRADELEVLTSPTEFTWSILCTNPDLMEVKLKQFAKGLYGKNRKDLRDLQLYGIRLEEKPKEIVYAEFSNIKEKLKKMSDQKIAIVICVIPPDSSDYDEIKFNADLDIGIMTQCIKSDTLTKFSEFRQTFLLNINAKLDGINQKLSTAPILKDFDTTPIMFIGAYLTSSTAPGQQNAPSIAGMVASRDRDAFRYNVGCTTKASFRSNFTKNLKSFREENKCLPKKLIYFRNDESGCSPYKTIESERKDMIAACNEAQEGHGKNVEITIIIVEPERHMRLFARANANDDNISNVPPGTIFDTFITQQQKKQFYMVSQVATEGVTRPTKYTIFQDDGKHCIYDLQELTFFMCHMFASCNRSVSFPAPIYHALRVAKRSQVYHASNASVDADNSQDHQVKVKGMHCI